MTYTKLITLLVVAIGMVQTADAGLEWVALGTAPNANNMGTPDTAQFTIGVKPSAAQLASVDPQLINIGQYTINMSFDFIGALDDGVNDPDLMIGVMATNEVPALSAALGSGIGTPLMVGDDGSLRFTQSTSFGGPPAPTIQALNLTADSNGVIPLLTLDLTMPAGTFVDGALEAFSGITLSLDAGTAPFQTQFGEIGSLDSPQNMDPLFDATPTANPDSPNSGVAGDTHVVQVGTAPAVPEPSSFLCLSMIVFATGGARWYRKRQAVAVSEEA